MEKVVLLIVFLFSVCEGAARPSCRWTDNKLRDLNEKCTEKLKSMGNRIPLECLDNNNNNTFPKEIFSKCQNEDLVLVALETLKGVSTVFKNNLTSVTWDRHGLGLFKNIINRQVERLQECVGKKDLPAMDKPVDNNTVALRSYFENLEEQLKEKDFSSCGWEMVRSELQDGLESFQAFLQSKKS